VIIGNAVSSLTDPIGLTTNNEEYKVDCRLCGSDEHTMHYAISIHTSSTVVIDLLNKLELAGLLDIQGIMNDETGDVE
jgi:hypothetical protein